MSATAPTSALSADCKERRNARERGEILYQPPRDYDSCRHYDYRIRRDFHDAPANVAPAGHGSPHGGRAVLLQRREPYRHGGACDEAAGKRRFVGFRREGSFVHVRRRLVHRYDNLRGRHGLGPRRHAPAGTVRHDYLARRRHKAHYSEYGHQRAHADGCRCAHGRRPQPVAGALRRRGHARARTH